jgi:IclR family transcriptional regulator, pca regulon regulatory protein
MPNTPSVLAPKSKAAAAGLSAEAASTPVDGSAPVAQEDEAGESGTFVVALARGLAVMRAFTSQNQHLTLSDVSKIVKLPRATVRRCLLTLQALGYVDSRDRYFSLSPKVLTIAQAYLTSSVLPRVSQNFLERLSAEIGVSCSVSILHGQDVIYVARSARKRMASLHREVGTQLPAHCTSMGRVLLAALSEPELESFFAEVKLTRYTPATVTSPSKLMTILKKVAKDGYCIVDGELEVNLRAIAVPIRNAAGSVVGALNVSTQASRTTRAELVDQFLPVMLQTVAELRPLLVS